MPHRVRYKIKTKSNLSLKTTSRQSYQSHLSNSSVPTSIQSQPSAKHQSRKNYAEDSEDFEFSPRKLVTSTSSNEIYVDPYGYQDITSDEPQDEGGHPVYPQTEPNLITTELRATNPYNFAKYFPSSKVLSICHDVLSSDNHMNLRVDTEDLNHRGVVQLFHLRIQDLKMRRFSLRRYERASGREICKTSRKHVAAIPVLPRSVVTVLAQMKLPSSKSTFLQKFQSDTTLPGDFSTLSLPSSLKPESKFIATNIIRLDFSNYAQVELRCRGGSRHGKRYEFEYWGNGYIWRRVSKREEKYKGVSYHLNRTGVASAVAYIVPEFQNQWQQYQERKAGNWIPPCSMCIADTALEENGSDVADVILATGLVALVDDNMERNNDDSSQSWLRFGKPIYEPLVPITKEE